METKLLQLALEKLSEDYEKLKNEVKELRAELAAKSIAYPEVPTIVKDDELLNYKDVQLMLGVCYNSLKKLIKLGDIIPIRLNERRIRFSKQSILNYIKAKSTLS